MHYGQLNVYHGDPSSFVTEQTVGLSRHDVDYDAQVTSIAANTEHDSVLFVDAKTNTLYNFDNFNLYMNQTSQQFTAMHTGISATTSQIAYDWLSKNVYWTDGFYKWIATHPVMKKEDMSLYKVLVTKHLTKPEGIAVDPHKRYVYLLRLSDYIRLRLSDCLLYMRLSNCILLQLSECLFSCVCLTVYLLALI